MLLSKDLRRRISYIGTSLGLLQKGFYTPYNYLQSIDPIREEYPEIGKYFDQYRERFQDFIKEMGKREEFFIKSTEGFPKPDWEATMYAPLDAAALHTMIALKAPKKVLEIGSGNSTHHMLRAILDNNLDTHVTCIDPVPRIEVGDLPVTLERRVFSKDDVEIARALEPNDVLFVDSSHILQTDFDVDIIFNRIFPILKPGVIVHVHDVFLPYPYPSEWDSFRWNEQIALTGWLMSGYFEPLFSSHFSHRKLAEDLKAVCPNRPVYTPLNGGALWMRKT